MLAPPLDSHSRKKSAMVSIKNETKCKGWQVPGLNVAEMGWGEVGGVWH